MTASWAKWYRRWDQDSREMNLKSSCPHAQLGEFASSSHPFSSHRGIMPEAFFLANFLTRTSFFIFTKRWEPRKESLWSKLLGSSLSCHQLLTVVSDWRIFLIALRIIWLDGLNIFGDVIGQKKMTSLTAVKCWAEWMWDSQRSWPEAFFSLGSGLPSALRVANFQIEKIILKESLWDQGIVTSKIVWNRRSTLEVRFFKNIQNWIF